MSTTITKISCDRKEGGGNFIAWGQRIFKNKLIFLMIRLGLWVLGNNTRRVFFFGKRDLSKL